jgi:alkanesulfonate monooxygenase
LAGIRAVRGGAGTALVGSHARVAELMADYRAAGVDLVIGSGYPHDAEVTRVGTRIWPLLAQETAA